MNETIWLLMGFAAAFGVLVYLRIAGQEWTRRETHTRALAEIRAEQVGRQAAAAESTPPNSTPPEDFGNAMASIAADTSQPTDSPTSASPQGPKGRPSR